MYLNDAMYRPHWQGLLLLLEGGQSSELLGGNRTHLFISFTGLLAAAVCADRFERVVVIEADEGADNDFPAAATKRKIDAYGNSSYVSRRPRVAQTFEVHGK